jgi:hypothetical protein
MDIVRESQPNHAHDHWMLSTNRPYRFLGSLWLLNGILFSTNAILYYAVYLSLPFSFLGSMLGVPVALAVSAAYSFAGGVFLRHDSQTIHRDPFPEGSPCNSHSSQMAYDWCAICGALKCAQELVRIRQSLKSSSGMFGFDGVACQRCAQRRVRGLLAISTVLLCAVLPLIVVSAVGMFMLLPSPLAVLFVVILAVVLLPLVTLEFWLWRRGWRMVTTPLSELPRLMTPTAARLVEKGTVGDAIRFKRVAALST